MQCLFMNSTAQYSTPTLHHLHSQTSQQDPSATVTAAVEGCLVLVAAADQLPVLVHGTHGVQSTDGVDAVLPEVLQHCDLVGLAEGLG